MIWQNPWAWLGLATVALPVIIHLFGRGHARVHRFPTLRFIDASRLLPTRRSRINDVLLLMVRAALLVVAVAALARPLLLTARRSSAANATLARVLILDTSASVTPAGRAALDSVSRATHFARDATTATTISTDDPSAALAGAVAWLGTQPMRGEIVVISRFQTGALDSTDIAAIPARVGIRLMRVPVTPTTPVEIRTAATGAETIARVVASPDRTDVEWSASSRAIDAMPVMLAGASERRRADAARIAAATVPVALPVDSAHPIVVVQPGYEQRASLLNSSTTPRRAWMMDVVARLAADSTLLAAARSATVVAPADSVNTLVVARTDSGRPIILAGEATDGGRERLLLFSLADAGSMTSAALLAAVAHAASLAPSSRSVEPFMVSDAELSSWQRAPATETRPINGGRESEDSDGRWLWFAVLALLALETFMRRERRIAEQQEIARDRAA